MFKYSVLFFFFLSIIYSHKDKSKELEMALNYSGENRKVLEQVLNHYNQNPADSLRLKAAIFLIENMVGKYSYQKEHLYKFYDEAIKNYNVINDSILVIKMMENVKKHFSQYPKDSNFLKNATYSFRFINGNASFKKNYLINSYSEVVDLYDGTNYMTDLSKIIENQKVLNNNYSGKIKSDEDIKVLTADFLIDNIDRSFFLWNTKPWLRHLTFEDFCEFILPYNVVNYQPIEKWKSEYYGMYDIDYEFFEYCTPYENSTYHAAKFIHDNFKNYLRNVYWEDDWIPVLSPYFLQHLIPEANYENVLMNAIAMRSNGVPVVIDFTPQWAHKEKGHSWNVLLTSHAKELHFTGRSGISGMIENPGDKMGKVFRNTYAINHELNDIIKTEKYVPELFRLPFFKDVTSHYMKTVNITLPIKTKMNKEKYLWISHFSVDGWKPVHWGYYKNKKANFNDMGKDCLYLASKYTMNGIEPINYPFTISLKGDIKMYEPDTFNLINLEVARTYYRDEKMIEIMDNMIGSSFHASNDADFKEYVTIDSVEIWNDNTLIEIQDTKKYRYWRYIAPPKKYCTISEINFYDENEKSIKGKFIGWEIFYDDDDVKRFQSKLKLAFDDDPTTLFRSKNYNAWVGMDFEKPVNISKIIYRPFTDNNDIKIGDVYELFYHDLTGWISLGEKKADDIKIKFENVPSNSIYWLKNKSRKTDERPFSYENNQFIWW